MIDAVVATGPRSESYTPTLAAWLCPKSKHVMITARASGANPSRSFNVGKVFNVGNAGDVGDVGNAGDVGDVGDAVGELGVVMYQP
jgi:hypothetical protein